jgi:hypothetical protein
MRNPSGMRRRGPSGETRDREVKAAPEKMDRTAFSAETGPKFLENAVGLKKHAPKPVRVRGIVTPMLLVAIERHRIFNLVWHHIDLHRQLQRVQRFHHRRIKPGHRLRLQFYFSDVPVAF